MIKVDRIFFQDQVQIEALGRGGRTNIISVGNVVQAAYGSGTLGSIHVDVRRGVAILRRDVDGKPAPWIVDHKEVGETLIIALPPGCAFYGPADLGEGKQEGKPPIK